MAITDKRVYRTDMTRAQELLAQSLTLSPQEREALAYELLGSLEPDEAWESAWAQEAERRLARLKSREGSTSSSAEVYERMKGHLRRRG